MAALAQHICLRLNDNRVIAPSPCERRSAARAVLEQFAQATLLAFGLADTHLHLLAACARALAGELARRLEISLGRRLSLAIGFAPAYFKEVSDGSHLGRAFSYVLEQTAHHGLEWDPLHEASNLPDLLGLRPLGSYTATNVRQLLPRVTRDTLLGCLRLAALEPADEPLDRLELAVAAATGLSTLAGAGREALAARQALVQVAGHRLSARALAQRLGVCERTVYELRRRPPSARLVQAVRLQLGLIQLREDALIGTGLPFLA
jgi:hypothetical protein